MIIYSCRYLTGTAAVLILKTMTIKNIRVQRGPNTLNDGLPSGTSEDGGNTVVAVVTWNPAHYGQDPLFLSQPPRNKVTVEGEDDQGHIFKKEMEISSVGPGKKTDGRVTTFRAV
jgi:hypothetical protein